MPATDRFQIPYPGHMEDPFYESFQAMVRSQDAALFWAVEQSRFQFVGGGVVRWSGGRLEWSQSVYIISPETGVAMEIPAGDILVGDGQFVTVVPVAGARSATFLVMSVGQTVSVQNRSIVVAYRRGAELLLRGSVLEENGVVAGFSQYRSDLLTGIFKAAAPASQLNFYRSGASGTVGSGKLSVGQGESGLGANITPARAVIPIGAMPAWTITYWFRSSHEDFLGQQVKIARGGSSGPMVILTEDNGEILVEVKNDNGSSHATIQSATLPPGMFDWTMVTLSYNPVAQELEFYMNGSLIGGMVLTSYTSAVGADRIDFFSESTPPTEHVKAGDIRNIGLYRRRLSSGEISALHAAGPAHDKRFASGVYTQTPNFYWTGAVTPDGVVDVGSDLQVANLRPFAMTGSSDQEELARSRIKSFSLPIAVKTADAENFFVDGLETRDPVPRGRLLSAAYRATVPVTVDECQIIFVQDASFVLPALTDTLNVQDQATMSFVPTDVIWTGAPRVNVFDPSTCTPGVNMRITGTYILLG